MDVTVLLEPTIDLPRLAEVLDGLGHEGRLHTVRGWNRGRMAALYDAAKGHAPVDVSFVVPDAVGSLAEVIHDGQNTLPVFSRFQKRFARAEGGSDPAFGYNHNSGLVSTFTGPGYFVVRAGTGEHEGELEIDYTKVPTQKPPSWPAIRPNDGGVGALVFGGMVDRLRGLSTHVSIGRAFRGGKPYDAWFALVRRDPGAA